MPSQKIIIKNNVRATGHFKTRTKHGKKHARRRAHGYDGADTFVRKNVSDIPVAQTPRGGFGKRFPAPVLAGCKEPLVAGAPDLRGLWRVMRVEEKGVLVPKNDRMYLYRERNEQAGNRVVLMGGGTIADCRADGTIEHGIHDVSAFDFETKIDVLAEYKDNVLVLTPPSMPWFKVTRRIDEQGHMIWTRPDMMRVITLERIGDGAGMPRNTFAPRQPKMGHVPFSAKAKRLWMVVKSHFNLLASGFTG